MAALSRSQIRLDIIKPIVSGGWATIPCVISHKNQNSSMVFRGEDSSTTHSCLIDRQGQKLEMVV